MDSNFKPYNHISSALRIDGILAQPQANFEEVKKLPDRDDLTFTNGFYAYCAALFIDLRDSSTLPTHYNRPALARLYRAYISELVAICNSTPIAREINIVGDCVWAVYNTPSKTDMDIVFSLAYQANSLIKLLNYKLAKANYKQPIKAGIGMSYGRALMIKAGYNGSGIADVVYMGDVVNAAAKLAAKGSRDGNQPLMADQLFRQNLNDKNQGFMNYNNVLGCYAGSVVSTAMEDWYKENCI
jgi:class 3 adenylate cyclase